jgi:diguanylate cyclase (GGDEF)-like protein/putative nucleotidyltransferase with HDIG domain
MGSRMSPGITVDALAAVRHLSAAIFDASDEDAIYGTFASVLFRVFDLDRVHVCRMPEGSTSAPSTAFAPSGNGGAIAEVEYRVPSDLPSGVFHVRATGEALQVPDAPGSPLVAQQFVRRFRAASLIYLPLVIEGRVHAVTVLLSRTPRTFEPQQLEVAYTMANQVSAGLAVLDMRQRLNARAERSAALARAASALNARLDLRAVLDALCAESGHALAADVSGFYLCDPRGGGVAVAAHGVPTDSDWWGRSVALGEGMAGQVLLTGAPAVSNDYRGGAVIDADVMRHVETAFGVPVRWDGELKGALSIGFFTLRPILAEDIDTLQAIADLAAVACSNAEAFERVQAAARTDSLTGFLNHGAIQVRLREEIWRARREDAPLSCLLVDLDNFKPINDRHGHLVGDELLQQVATAIAAEFRPYDGVARYGGDEFVLVLPGADEQTALEAARRLRNVVAETSSDFGDLGAPVTASVGIARWREPLTAGELLDRADRALLLAKRHGKDGVEIASPRTEQQLARVEHGDDRADPIVHFWDMVSRAERPRHVLYTLPSLLRRELDLEEVALYEPNAGPGGQLMRLTLARLPGDPASPAFRRSMITIGPDLQRRLESGPISRGSLAALELALEGSAPLVPSEAPAGSYAAVGLLRGDALLGLMLLRHRLPLFPRTDLRTAEVLAGETVTVLLSQSGDSSRTAVAALAAAIDARDNYTLSHSDEVVGLACEVARRLGLPPAEVAKVRDGAMLHDIGKIAIPNEILYKSGPLSPSEWETMRGHPVIGERILRRTPELAPIAPLVRHEHERWDGGGYPDGLAGETIPIGSRIILACDAYHAMIAARPYRQSMSEEEAVEELRAGAGSQFDPHVVDALLSVLATRAPVVASGA